MLLITSAGDCAYTWLMNVVKIIASKSIQFKLERRRVRNDIFAVDVNTTRDCFDVAWVEIAVVIGVTIVGLPGGWNPITEDWDSITEDWEPEGWGPIAE